MKFTFVDEGLLHPITFPKVNIVSSISAAELEQLEWVGDDTFNRFTTMKALRDVLWPYYSSRPKIDRLAAILLNVDGSACIVECYFSSDYLLLALAQLSRFIESAKPRYYGYVLCRVISASKRHIAFSYCNTISGAVVRDDFVDHLDRDGRSTALYHAVYGKSKANFVNLFSNFAEQMSADDFLSPPAET